ncbi:MAG: glycerol-3-phosphate dehydrogenase/oxidase [Candidatus Eisenbacteria bacterium]
MGPQDSRRDPVDLAIVGGGITGAGIASLAARRGLSVVLLERRDLMSGASSASSHMLHGGLRYLEHGHVGLVREALRERAIVSRIAPAHTRPVRFVVPLYRGDRVGPWTLRAGLTAYDLLAGRARFAPHQMMGTRATLALEPGLANRGLRGAGIYTDIVMDDAGLGIAVARDAARHGAAVHTWTEVMHARREGARIELGVRDTVTGDEGEVVARCVVVAAGPWTDEVRARLLPGLDPLAPPPRITLRPTRGTHLVYPALTAGHGLVLVSRSDGRVFFVVPFGEHALVGTTEVEVPSPPAPESFTPDLDELTYLRDGLTRVLPGSAAIRPLAVTTGIRPLLRAEGDANGLSREHAVLEDAGVFTIAGGKYTTFRVMARDVLVRVLRRLGYPGNGAVPADRALPAPPAEELSLEKRVDWAVREDFARRLEDVLRRRSRLWLEPDRARRLAPQVAARMAGHLGWSEERTRREVADWDVAMNEEERLIDRAAGVRVE